MVIIQAVYLNVLYPGYGRVCGAWDAPYACFTRSRRFTGKVNPHGEVLNQGIVNVKVSFQDTGVRGVNVVKTVESDSPERTLKISPSADGPFALQGEAEIVSADGQTCYSGNRMYLCRCGASSNKPFCDGTHTKLGFTSGE